MEVSEEGRAGLTHRCKVAWGGGGKGPGLGLDCELVGWREGSQA